MDVNEVGAASLHPWVVPLQPMSVLRKTLELDLKVSVELPQFSVICSDKIKTDWTGEIEFA